MTAKWYYTENELPEQYEECFCDTGEFHGYKTLTYSGTEFYDKECVEFKVTGWHGFLKLLLYLTRIRRELKL